MTQERGIRPTWVSTVRSAVNRSADCLTPAGCLFVEQLIDRRQVWVAGNGPPQLPEVMALADRYGQQGGSQTGCLT
jgi:hypothetical protein